jgi:hypothetical protein
MAILTVPFTTIYLVAHSGGGALLHAGGQYVAGTLVPAVVVTAANSATSALANAGSSLIALGSNPAVLGVAAVTVAAVGAYCYFYGIPAPIEALLMKAGLATSAKGGLAITVAKLATAFVVLGAAGLLTLNVYKRVVQARRAQRAIMTVDDARGVSEAAFGPAVWEQYGEPLWLGTTDTVDQIVGWARKAADATSTMLDQPVAIGDVVGVGATVAAGAGGAAAGAAYAAGTVTVLGSSTLGGIGLSLGLVSAPVWPVIAGGLGAAGLGYLGWKVLRSSMMSNKGKVLGN